MNARKLHTALRAASLLLSVLVSFVIFGSVAIGLTWNAGLPAFI